MDCKFEVVPKTFEVLIKMWGLSENLFKGTSGRFIRSAHFSTIGSLALVGGVGQ